MAANVRKWCDDFVKYTVVIITIKMGGAKILPKKTRSIREFWQDSVFPHNYSKDL